MFDTLYAKSDGETIKEHTDKLLAGYDKLMSMYGTHFSDNEKELIRLACEYHDLGKSNQIFQELMHGNYRNRDKQIPHGFLSGAYFDIDALEKRFSKSEIKALLTAVHYHHDREDKYSDDNYKEYIEKYIGDSFRIRYLRRRLFRIGKQHAPKYVNKEDYQKYMLIKGILNKLDYAASAYREKRVEISCDINLPQKISECFDKLRPAQEFMRANKDSNVIVIAPTGSGKTEAALLWADNCKTFYTLPLKVSANDIYKRIHTTYGYTGAGLLHSGSIFLYFDKDNNPTPVNNKCQTEEGSSLSIENYRSVRRLAMPLTVCTVDQLFKFVFKAQGTEILAATLKYSKVIIDEMQMYDPEIAAMIIYGLRTITEMGGKYAIITATLPPFMRDELGDTAPVCAEFLDCKYENRHIVSYSECDFDYEKILKDAETKKVLVICNTVKKAQEVFQNLPGAHLLHGRFLQRDRQALEKAIIDFARGNEHGIWISTQIVEASLDIDFDVLYTEMCNADSLLQRMGRCFRSREYMGIEANVYICDNGNDYKIYDSTIYDRSVEFIKQYCQKVFTEAEKQEYINTVFDKDGIKGSKYYKKFKDTLKSIEDIPVNCYTKHEADELFRNIHSYDVIPDSVYNQNAEDINKWIDTIIDKKADLSERLKAESELTKLTVSIDAHSIDNKYKDLHPIGNSNIYRTEAVYEFDEDTLAGRGLLREWDDLNRFM